MIEKINIIGHWRIDAIIGLELMPNSEHPQTDEYILQELQEKDKIGRGIFGWGTEFRSNGTFESYYSSPDGFGNTNIAGTFKFIDEYHIRIFINKITLMGIWKSSTELGVFLIARTENGFRLIKCTDGETDLQRLTYSDMVRALPEIRTGSRDLKWVTLDPYNRYTDNLKILNKGLAADGRYNPDKAKLLYSRYIEHGEVLAFVFRYEGENVIAFYSWGPHIFAIYDVIQPPFLHLKLEETEEYISYLVRLEKDERVKEANLSCKYENEDADYEFFLRGEIETIWKGVEKRSKHEIVTFHYYMEERFEPIREYRYDVLILEYRTDFSQISVNGTVDKNHSYDPSRWHYIGNIHDESILENFDFYEIIYDYWCDNKKKIPVLRGMD